MKRSLLAIAGALALCAVVPATAGATITELGATTSPLVAPTCPKGVASSQCTIILTRATALETIRDDIAYPTTVKQAGRLVAFTVGLSSLSTSATTAQSDTSYLDKTYGGDAQVGITVLKRVGKKTAWTWEVVASSPLVDVQTYLGQVVQFPLLASIPVVRGEVVALTTPTWAPVLSIDLSTHNFAYRQSRSQNCFHPPSTSQAQVTAGASAKYVCDYPGTRVEYSATEVSNPVPTSTTTTTTTKTTKK
ncbi:MAG TPA: hypothetical protein VMF57_09905 [Solirubrobacteraceae bacterium]|nr:hypothetical protein [Solirubrobacteraceae bacterium]